jgi:Putative porin
MNKRMNKIRKLGLWWAALLVTMLIAMTAVPVTARAEDKDDAAHIRRIIELLRQKRIISDTEAEALKQRPSYGAAPGAGAGQGAAAPDTQKEIKRLEEKLDRRMDDALTGTRINAREIERLETERIDKLADQALKSSWAQRISFNGDMRLRYESIAFDEDNYPDFRDPANPDTLVNSTEDRQRYRARVRLGLKATLIDPRDVNVGKVEAAVRLTTGNSSDPVSTNETLGDDFNKDGIVLDRYYLKWTYKPELPIWGRIPQISLSGGRMPNPWFSSDLVWDDDLNFEGFVLNLRTDTLDENGWYIFLTGGAFPLQELELNDEDKWLYGAQLGLAVKPFYGLNITLGAAYYDYRNITGTPDMVGLPGYTAPNVPNQSSPLYQQKGNTLMFIDEANSRTALAADYDIVDITTEIDMDYFFPVHVILGGTYATNVGFDQAAVNRRASANLSTARVVDEETEAYQVGLKVGYPTIGDFGEWNVFYQYKYIEADAVLDAFNDSDFHLGGTNCKGWLAGLEFGLFHNVWLRSRWITSDEISGPQFAVDILQIDINARF